MPGEIKWSVLAEADFNQVLEYLSSHWNSKIAYQFIQTTEENLSRIVNNPKLHPLINKELQIRKCVITEHNSLFYRINEKGIILLRIYDTRQNPDTLQF